jgi:hypothetical protein
MLTTPLAALLLLLGGTSTEGHVTVGASFVPASKAGGNAHVAVTLLPRDPDVRVNEEPAVRLKLAADEAVLLDKQPAPARSLAFDPATAKYLDPAVPVHLPVAIKPDAPRGKQQVKAKVTYFYCSKREGWCRKGTEDVQFPVDVR